MQFEYDPKTDVVRVYASSEEERAQLKELRERAYSHGSNGKAITLVLVESTQAGDNTVSDLEFKLNP